MSEVEDSTVETGRGPMRRRIERLAIVNRGEAAVRCLRTAKSLRALEGEGLEVVALYTPPDRDAPFVRQADRAVELPAKNGAVAAYLDHDAVVAALREVGADAVWPGWGFVAEDPIFVERLSSEGIVFLGPSAEAMRSLGDKITSKRLAEKAGVPVTEWSGGELADEHEALRHAERIGFPVVLKATAGGGGRGIRIVHRPDEIAEAYRSASSEAAAAFGNGALFVEAMVQGGRHIEVQVAADEHGYAVAFGCRDCSVQRRHQKVLEEAPPPGLSGELLARLETSAVRLVEHVGYTGVGTVEFLVTGEDFFFLEVNPRLQVEHGITELIVGIDLVEIQIRIARGESIREIPIGRRGIALEARVCAEDPDEGFLPSPGRIALFEPALGPNIRVDSGVTTGAVISADFDSLIAKVITVGDDRAEVIARLSCALRDLELIVEGGASNKGYLLSILESDDFRAGGVDTQWLDRWSAKRPPIAESRPDLARDALVAAAILSYQRTRRTLRTGVFGDQGIDRLPSSEGQQIDLNFGPESYRLKVYAIGSWRYRVHLEGVAVGATMREEGEHAARLIIDDRVRRILYDANDRGLRLEVDGHAMRFGSQTAGQVRSGTPAVVVAIQVAVGDEVEVGQPLGLLEAMKMEIGFQAPVGGTIKEIIVQKGQQVAAGDVILVIEEIAADESAENGRSRLSLPAQIDPLALLFQPEEDKPLGRPDLETADRSALLLRRSAIDTIREEVRRVLLGYDANPDRAESLTAFLEAPLPENISESFSRELAEIRHELTAFADVEVLSIRAPSASISGESGPSNSARLRMLLRRVEAEGAGIDDGYLDLVRAALGHYGVVELSATDALRRALLRILSCQADKSLRLSLILGVLRRITAVAQSGIYLGDDDALSRALNRIARLRPQVSDPVADAALEATYVIFQRPGIEERARRSSSTVETWLAAAEMDLVAPPSGVLLEVASSPRLVFERVGRWIVGEDPNRRAIALAAHVQRRYAPRRPEAYRAVRVDGEPIHCVEYKEAGVVLAATGAVSDTALWMDRLVRGAASLLEHDPETPILALEYLIPAESEIDWEEKLGELRAVYREESFDWRMTIGLLTPDGEGDVYRTFVRRDGQLEHVAEHHDLHPETAARIALDRYADFELERLHADEGIYAFHGRARTAPADERIFVLADARDRSPEPGRELHHHLATFERVFNRAARTLRTTLQTHDPRRRLQWNRIAIFVAPSIYIEPGVANEIAGRLAPATRHLGLEKVLVRLNRLDREAGPDASPMPCELVISDTGEHLEVDWREPHNSRLTPTAEYQRKVVAARHRRQIYPYEIVKMLTNESDDGTRSDGQFEEHDLDPTSTRPLAMSVAGRPYGENVSSVVFGLVRTPTDKVPEGMLRVLVLSDPTMGMGSLARPECDRVVAAIDLAESLGVPLEWVPVSSGAKIAMDSGTENLDATARVVRRIVTFTQAGGVVHVIVQGVNVGAQSYWDALATMLMHTRGALIMTQNASMVLTGRAALEASGAVSAEDEIAIGGFERIMGPNGEAQYFARNLADAYRILYEHYRYTYVVPGEAGPREFVTDDPHDRSIGDTPIEADDADGLETIGELFDDETNPGRKRAFSMRAVMKSVVDVDGGHLERWNAWVGAETAIIWDAHVGGKPVTLIGIESRNVPRDGYHPVDGPESWNGGTLFPQSSKKVARAINAASGNRPVVVLANLSGFDGSPESLRKMQLENGAEIARSVVNFEGPIYFVVVSRYHGGAYVVFSQELNDGMQAVALSGSYASVIGGGPAAAVVFSREVRAQALGDPRVKDKSDIARRHPTEENRAALEAVLREVTLEKQAEMAAEFDAIHTVERAREVGSLSAILDPADLRPQLIAALDVASREN